MTAETLALIATCFLCSEAAEVRILDKSEAETCMAAYTEMKLSFVSDVNVTAFTAMTTVERAQVNRRGYAAYVAWTSRNPELVQKTKAKARAQLASADS